MKTKLSLLCSLFAALSLLALATTTAFAQGTAFNYQGRLDNGGTPANGFYDVTFTLFSVASGAGQIGSPQTSLATPVSNGLFTVTLDFGANFPGAGRWLELAVRTNGGGVYTVLEPRQPITAAPYAITAGTITGTITEAQLPGNTARLNVANNTSQATAVPVITSGFITGATITSGGSGYITPPTVTVNAALGSGAVITAGISGGVVTVLTVQNAGSGYTSGATITIAPPPSNSYQVFTSTNYFGAANFLTNANNTMVGNFSGNGAGLSNLPAWRLTGNAGTTAGTHFIGTTDNQPLAIHFDFQRLVRLEYNGDSSSDFDAVPDGTANVIAGSAGNFVGAGVVGATISGGGATNYDFAPDQGHQALSDYATVSGGMGHSIATNAHFSTIGGGRRCYIGADSAHSTIAGGYANSVDSLADFSTISGGFFNRISVNAARATIAGGYQNIINFNSDASTIGGGYGNTILLESPNATIAGGYQNAIGQFSEDDTISGGRQNSISLNTARATIAGGYLNTIGFDGDNSTIGGGLGNTIGDASQAGTIAGGNNNRIGTNSPGCVIGGGGGNIVATNSFFATIPGGLLNFATNYAFAAGSSAKAIHQGAFVWGDSTIAEIVSSAPDSVTFRAAGGYRFFSNTFTNSGVSLPASANAWASISDRNRKKDIEPLDGRTILDKLAGISISTWHYDFESAHDTPHIGPMAQDFKAAFYPGRDDKTISTMEFDGVALAAIQGLNQKLETENADLKARLEKLERLVKLLAAKN